MIRRLSDAKARADRVELPKGAVIALCATLLALPASLAIAHTAHLDSGGGWIHHHTTTYSTCNLIDQSADLKTQAGNARSFWMSLAQTGTGSTYGLSDVSLPHQAECHPGNDGQTHIQMQDAYYGNTGWRASSADEQGANAYNHARHTHINFNLSPSWADYGNYDRRALACRAIGEVIGVSRVWSSQWSSHGTANDCMSCGGAPASQVSKAENATSFTYTDKPGDHSRDLLDARYADHILSLELAGPLYDLRAQGLVDDYYELWISTEGPAKITRVRVTIDGQVAQEITEPCQVDDEFCTEDVVFEFLPGQYSSGQHSILVTAWDTYGQAIEREFPVQIVSQAEPGDSYTETPAPVSGSGSGCQTESAGTVEEGVVLVANGQWSGGPETTQYFDEGAYTVSRCDSAGALVVEQEVEEVVLDDGTSIPVESGRIDRIAGIEYSGHYMTYPDPAGTTAADWADASSGVISPTPFEGELPPSSATALSVGTPNRGCDSRQFDRNKWIWNFNPSYRIHRGSLQDGAKSKRRIIRGHQAWNSTNDACGMKDTTPFRMTFAGLTDAKIDLHDDRDTVDFGPLGEVECSPDALACANPGGTRTPNGYYILDEVDIRFNGSRNWYSGTVKPPSTAYDLLSTATHEAGHKLGLSHVPVRTDQTMCTKRCAAPGLILRRTLGRGDVRGMRRLYNHRGDLGPDPR